MPLRSAKTLLMLAVAAAVGVLALEIAQSPPRAGDVRAGTELSDLVVAPAVAASARARATAAEPILDVGVIARRGTEAARAADAFAARSWVRPPPPPPPEPAPAPAPPPPPPQAPPLPFKYLGRLEQPGGPTLWYLGQGDKLIVAVAGENIDGAWRLDGFSAGRLRLTYLPLDLPQTLATGATP
jgi:hypothetical protein